jgi:hypothetical protein
MDKGREETFDYGSQTSVILRPGSDELSAAWRVFLLPLLAEIFDRRKKPRTVPERAPISQP